MLSCSIELCFGSPSQIATGPSAGGSSTTLRMASRTSAATLRFDRAAASRNASQVHFNCRASPLPQGATGNNVTEYRTPLDTCPRVSYRLLRINLVRKDAPRRHVAGWGEGGARGRICSPLPGRPGHYACRYYDWRVRCSLDWDRRRRVTPVRTESQEAWPGLRLG